MDNNSILAQRTALHDALDKCRSTFYVVFVFAFCINVLMVITPLYTLQVLDRVIGSGSMQTLLMLSLIIGLVHFVYTLLQITRSYTLIRIGEWLDKDMSPLLFSHSVSAAAVRPTVSAVQLIRDFQSVKTFLTSIGINSLLDAPWSIVYIIVIFMIHPYLGFLTIIGGVIVVSIALLNAVATNKTLGEAGEYSMKGLHQAEIATRNAEVVEAMGMMNNVSQNWHHYNKQALAKQSVASYRNGLISNGSRFIRNIMQMCVTAIGAYVVVTTNGQDMTVGGMIASSILVGRALAPFDNAIEVWKQISNSMKSYQRIVASLRMGVSRGQSMELPDIIGKLSTESVSYTHAKNLKPGEVPKYVVEGVSFVQNPGEIMAVIGPSAAGKSTLAKLLVGVWKPSSGIVRLDGAEVYTWNRENFGKHVGYLPQGIELFSGTIKQNIARMEEDSKIDPKHVVEAAKMAGAHEMILSLPNGYDSDIGVAGCNLSGGQRQRVGLARAFYGDPKLVILDEPNANLDEAGEVALSNALNIAKTKKITVLVISHRPSVLNVVDKIMVLRDGKILSIGTKEDVMKQIQTLRSGTIHIND